MSTEFNGYIQGAIGLLNQQINSLEKLGIRDGCLVQSSTSANTLQWHWAIGGKRVKELRSKVEALRNVL